MTSVKMFFDGTEIGEWAAFGLFFFVITLLFYYPSNPQLRAYYDSEEKIICTVIKKVDQCIECPD